MVFVSFGLIKGYCQKAYEYPKADIESTFNVYFGDTIYDPYQWMENPNDPRLNKWLEEQKSFTKKFDKQQTRRSTLRAQIGSIYFDSKSKVRIAK